MVEITFEKSDGKVKWLDHGCYLHWVYLSDSPKQFFLIPAATLEFDNEIVSEEEAQRKRKEFFADSRSLFHQHNINVKEKRFLPGLKPLAPIDVFGNLNNETRNKPAVSKKDRIKYGIQVLVVSREWSGENIPVEWRSKLKFQKSNKVLKYRIGDWENRDQALEVLKEVRTWQGFEDAFIVTIESDEL